MEWVLKRQLGMTMIWWILGIAAAIVALKLIIVWAEPYMSFVPRKGATPPPQGFHAIDIIAKDGTKLTGWRTEIPTEGPVFLYFCGNAGNLSDREDLMSRCAAAGLSIIAFNYRGTGESQGQATEASVHSDALEIQDHLAGALSVDPQRIVLWGHSIGGAVAAGLANRRPVAGLVLESTFRSGLVMAKRMLPFLPVSWFMTYKFDNESSMSSLRCPVLFIHGSHDFTIPPADSEYLYNLVPGEKEIWMVDGADHNDVYEVAGDAFFSRLAQFGQQVAMNSTPAN